VVAPLYYGHYYKTEGRIFPSSMDWTFPAELRAARAARDAAPLKSLEHMLRLPPDPIAGASRAVPDAFVHIVWMQIWRAEEGLRVQPWLSSAMSDLYIRGFAGLVPAGTVWFLARRRQVPRQWREWGWILLTTCLLFCFSALAFGWGYPVFGYGVFKAKYMSPALLWIPYAAVLPLSGRSFDQAESGWRSIASTAALLVLVMFVCVNHLLPVY
jgi:hypothetical protein